MFEGVNSKIPHKNVIPKRVAIGNKNCLFIFDLSCLYKTQNISIIFPFIWPRVKINGAKSI